MLTRSVALPFNNSAILLPQFIYVIDHLLPDIVSFSLTPPSAIIKLHCSAIERQNLLLHYHPYFHTLLPVKTHAVPYIWFPYLS